MHVLDPAFASAQPVPPGATAADYRRMQGQLGTTRTVVVQARPYGFDNRVVLDAIAQLGADRTRGVAVVHPGISDGALETLHHGGIRGVRFTLYTPTHAPLGFDQVQAVADRIRPWGWHLQLHWTADQIVEHAGLLNRLQVPLVFDHLARLPLPAGTTHPAFATVCRLIDQGHTWVKLSGAYLCSHTGLANGYQDTTPLAQAWLQAAPERLVWGSDWPHVTESAHPPDTPGLLDLLGTWAPSSGAQQRVLVDNPALLYGF